MTVSDAVDEILRQRADAIERALEEAIRRGARHVFVQDLPMETSDNLIGFNLRIAIVKDWDKRPEEVRRGRWMVLDVPTTVKA